MSKRRVSSAAAGKHYRAARKDRRDDFYCPSFYEGKFIAAAVLFCILVFIKGIVLGYFLKTDK
jgi:hypothetical protein